MGGICSCHYNKIIRCGHARVSKRYFGGKADMAMAGGTDASKLAAALQSVQGWVAERV